MGLLYNNTKYKQTQFLDIKFIYVITSDPNLPMRTVVPIICLFSIQ